MRSDSTAIIALIEQASERSATFRHLLDTINASDSMVYVQEGDCLHGVHACFTTVSMAGSRRVMWVKVSTRKADWDLMGSIGHELRHTIEVLGDPTVTSNSAMSSFYLSLSAQSEPLAGNHGSQFETQAAIDAGNAVRREARAAARQAKAE